MGNRAEVRRRVAELAATVVAVNHGPLDTMRPRQRPSRLDNISFGDALTHVGARPDDVPMVAMLDDGGELERDLVDGEPVHLAELLEQRHVPCGPMTEPEVLSDDHTDRGQPVDEHPVDELRGCPRRQLLGERQHEHGVSTDLAEQPTRCSIVESSFGCASGLTTALGCGSNVTATTAAPR